MNDRTEMTNRIVDMLQRVNDQKVRFVYVLLRAMMGEEEAA